MAPVIISGARYRAALAAARKARMKRLRKPFRGGIMIPLKREMDSFTYLEPEIKIEAGLVCGDDPNNAQSDIPRVRCTLCGEMIPLPSLEKHKILEEMYLNSLKCITCGVTFAKKSAFRLHIYEQHKVHHCKICSEMFSKRQLYRNHVEKKHDLRKSRVPCEICGRLLANNQILKRHRNEVHFGLRDLNLKCPQCDYRAYNKSNLKVHIDKHNNTPGFVCDLCGKGCYTKTSLSDHAVNTHGHGFKCTLCGKIYRNECSLKAHVKIHEPGFDPSTLKQQCEHCGEFFNHISSLKKHLLKHLGLEKTFDCDVCGKKVSSKGSYRSHMAIHSGYKPYACEYCDKRFADKQYLTQHRRVHTGEKPFKCEDCGQYFNQRSSLNRHKRFHANARVGR